jgi:hypothetical protein
MDGSLYVMGKHAGHYPKYYSGDKIGKENNIFFSERFQGFYWI